MRYCIYVNKYTISHFFYINVNIIYYTIKDFNYFYIVFFFIGSKTANFA